MQNLRIAYGRKQAAAEIGLSPRTVDYLIKRGDLKARKIGKRVLIPGSELVKLLEKGIRGNPSTIHPVEV
jgi:excisionase family DNA binding protein